MNLKEWAVRQGVHPKAAGRTVVYARVSSAGRRSDLDRQVARVTEWVTREGGRVDQVVTEVGLAPPSETNSASWRTAELIVQQQSEPRDHEYLLDDQLGR